MNSVAFLGNYAPRCCGIATFTQDLRAAVQAARPSLHAPVAMMSDNLTGYSYPEEVRMVLDEKDRSSYVKAAEVLNRSGASVVSLQHEYGIFGGPSGSWLLDLLRMLRMPVVTTCHTVLKEPNPEQRQVMSEIARLSAQLIVMAEKGRELLQEVYGVPAHKITVIPHGIPNPDVSAEDRTVTREGLGWSQRHVLFTFGLLGPSKGLEHAIRALPEIARQHPDVLYVVAGATHPNLVREQGEQYRESLQALAEELGVAGHLQFINHFVSREELVRLIAAADIYTTPYLNEAQITSGTLAYAFGMGKPVISTPYWHAAELLADDHGVLVPFGDVGALAEAALRLIADEPARRCMSELAYAKGRGMTWEAVGEKYLSAFESAVRSLRQRHTPVHPLPGSALPPCQHLRRLHGIGGIYQHAVMTEPDPAHGFCTDDNARAVICLTDLLRAGYNNAGLTAMFDDCFRCLIQAVNPRIDRFRNFMDKDGRWLEQCGSDDSHGRALWALGHVIKHHPSRRVRQAAQQVLRATAPAAMRFPAPRSWAFSVIGLAKYLDAVERDRTMEILRDELCSKLALLCREAATDGWEWFEDNVTYDNGKLPQALLAAARQTGNTDWRTTGLRTLKFLVKSHAAPDGHFRPVGSSGFWSRGTQAALWDQQPLEAQAMTSACLEAAALTGQRSWLREAQRAFAWFSGGNDLGIPVADAETGGCHDGLQENGVNLNQGAESTLAWLQASAEMKLASRLFINEGSPSISPDLSGPKANAAA